MSILKLFKKPNWKHKDAIIRARAVSQDTTPELKAQLSSISQNDASEMVRTAAVRRLNDYSLLSKIAQNDSHKTVKTAAYKLIQDWLKNSQDEQQLAIIKEISDIKTIEIAASHSKNKEIREFCINKIEKQGLLGDLLVTEKDKKLRQLLVSKITKPATLKRIAQLIKNKDKTSFKMIQSKLEGDTDNNLIVHKKALDLCEKMEKLIHNANNSSQQDVDKIYAKWQELKQDNNLDSLSLRFNGAHRTANLTFDPKQRDEFLNQQRQQRINSKILELKTSLIDLKKASWEELQVQLSKYSGVDLSDANSDQKKEFEELISKLKDQIDSQSKEQDVPEKLLEIADKLDATLQQKSNQPNQIVQFRKMWDNHASKAQNTSALSSLKARFDKAMLLLADRVESSATLRDEAAKNAVAAIEPVQKLIKEGQLSKAKIAINLIAENKKQAGFHPLIKDNKFAFDSLWNELKELRQWQTWSNDKIRTRIIDELRQLVGTGTHPDALLKKMQESNKLWKDMEDHEKLEGDKYGVRNQELYSQFRAVQEALFKPAQKFFEKRSEIWGSELEQVEANIQALYDVDLIETEDRDLARMVRDAIKQLRNLDKVPPRVRGKCASKIRTGINRIDKHLKESYKVAERRKEKLIEQALQLVELEDLDSAIEQAKALQSEWKNAGIVQQSQERKLWKAFRKANDAVFNRIQKQRDQVKEENKALFDQAHGLIKTCESAINKEKSAQGIHSLIEKFKDDFNAMKIDNKGLQSKANQLIDSCHNKVATLANSEIIDELKNTQKFALICQDLELNKINEEQAREKWGKCNPIAHKKIAEKLEKRLNNATKPNTDFIAVASENLVASEYLTGLASPDEYKEQRLAYQVNELSKRMGGEESLDATDKAVALLKEWFLLNGAENAFIKENDKRIKKIHKSLFELLKG